MIAIIITERDTERKFAKSDKLSCERASWYANDATLKYRIHYSPFIAQLSKNYAPFDTYLNTRILLRVEIDCIKATASSEPRLHPFKMR